jgi:ComF family protein
LKKLLHEAKYGARPSLLRVFREDLSGFARTLAGVFDLIVPVPLERRKMRERGFNQAKILASFLAGAADAPVAELMRKVYPTPSQSLLGRAERLKNLRGSFDVPCPERVRGKSILLVDDVYTTGATVRECALILKGCGARSVSVFALARAGSSWN